MAWGLTLSQALRLLRMRARQAATRAAMLGAAIWAPLAGKDGMAQMQAQIEWLDPEPPLTLAERLGERTAAEAAENAEQVKRWLAEHRKAKQT